MELWIRSQDKTTLKQVNVIDIYTPAESSCVNYTIISEGWELGQYKTKKRALEVLDEIHQKLIDLQTLEIAPDFRNTRNMDCVYEMPKE